MHWDIKSIVEFSHSDLCGQALTQLGGCMDNGSKYDVGLGDYLVHFTIEAKNGFGEEKEFFVVFETLERNDGLRAYSGYEMIISESQSDDQSDDLIKFLDYDDSVLNELKEYAESFAKSELKRLSSI